jgi:hypothetical protein
MSGFIPEDYLPIAVVLTDIGLEQLRNELIADQRTVLRYDRILGQLHKIAREEWLKDATERHILAGHWTDQDGRYDPARTQLIVSSKHLPDHLFSSGFSMLPTADPGRVSVGNGRRDPRGRKADPRWEKILIEAARYMYERQDPGTQAELFEHLRKWLGDADGGPSDTAMKEHVGPLWRAFKETDSG